METLKLYWMGIPLAELRGRPVKFETRKAVALLAYLSLSPGECQRELLATMFWPEGNQQKALANLRRTIFTLNSSLPGWIKADRDTITLKRESKLWIDVETFHRALSKLEEHSHSQKEACDECLLLLDKIADIYRGEFLEGLNLRDAPRFDEWQFFQRGALHQEFVKALERRSFGHAERQQWDRAIASARRWVALDGLHEPACRTLMNLLVQSGQRTAALRQYEELVHLLHEQMEQEPEPETQRLYEQIRGQFEAKQVLESAERLNSFPLLKTKLYIPTAPVSRVIRSRLIGRLDEVRKKPLTIISAPAGFGKTTLLAEWIAQTSLPVAWLSLDNGDNDPYRFLSYLIAALESIQEGVGTEAQLIMQSPQPVPPHIILACLINDLEKVARPCVLILDDYQFITERTVHETLAYLLNHLPANLHLVIATRADPPLQLGRLRAYGQMLELRTPDLRFTSGEATKFMNEVMRLALSVEDLQTLELRTEGWVVGLQMAALSLKGHANASDFIRDFSGSHRFVLDYLVEEVLKRQPTYVQTFLLETSVLEKLNGALCDTLMTDQWKQSGASGQAILEYLEDSNLFLIPLDDHKQWYRYHHLFADLLRARLKQFSAERVITLHLQASYWYEREGLTSDAINHAIDAKDFLHAAELVEKLADYSISPDTNYATLKKWIDQIPENLVSNQPWTCIAQAYISFMSRGMGNVEECLQKAENIVLRIHEEGDTHHVEEIQNNITILRAYRAFFVGDLVNAINQAEPLLEKQYKMKNRLRGQVYQAMGEFYLVAGELEKCVPLLREAMNLSIQIPNVFLFTRSAFRLGRALIVQGKLAEAKKVYQDSLRLLRDSGLTDGSLLWRAEIGLGDVIRERGDLVTAERLLTEGLKHAQLQGQPFDLVFAYLYLSRLEHAKGNSQHALELLEQADQLFQTYAIPANVRAQWEYYCVPIWIATDDREQIERWM
ncbi:MAG TPA: BTAD domain-containing putative transcriptional regulator, partial [Anaerolineales bacterium]|nr:BTAD domain-containing putative transcriptional regulator [Anaerolineales bacterium]